MYTLIKFILIGFVSVLISFCLQAQDDLIGVQPSIFTLRNSRITLGIIGHSNIAGKISDSADARPFIQFFGGELPDSSLEFDFESIDFPYSALGLSLDLFSPNSRIGLAISGEYNLSNYLITNSNNRYLFKSNRINLPFYLKYKFGSINGKEAGDGRENTFLAVGPYASIPISLIRTVGGVEENLKDVQINSYGISIMFGLVLRYYKENAIKNAEENASNRQKRNSDDDSSIGKLIDDTIGGYYTESPRTWAFIRLDHILTDNFDQNISSNIIPNSINPFSYKATNVTVGIAFFFGGKVSRK